MPACEEPPLNTPTNRQLDVIQRPQTRHLVIKQKKVFNSKDGNMIGKNDLFEPHFSCLIESEIINSLRL